MTTSLHLIPAPLAPSAFDAIVTPRVLEVLSKVSLVVAENPRTARRMLPGLGYTRPLQTLEILQYDEHSKGKDIELILEAMRNHEHVALLSEAGTPCIADPGSRLVRSCHRADIQVVPHGAASAILLALMASGLNGQRFGFNGYLPIASEERLLAVQELELRSKRENSSQLFIETPYRSSKLFQALCESLNASTELCVAQNLTSSDEEQIHTRRIADWKRGDSSVRDVPSIFIIEAAATTPR